MHNNPPQCSIVIPVYNGEQFIKSTIESCLHQTVPVEIIIINDASNDNSEELILEFEQNEVTYIKNKENIGLMKSLNKAIKHTNGQYLLMLGHDDILAPNHVEVMLELFDSNTSFVHCNSELIDANGIVFGLGVNNIKQYIKTLFIKKFLSRGCFIHSTGAIINKKMLIQVGGYDEQFRNYGEWLLWIKLASIGDVKYTSRVKAKYRRHEKNITNNFNDNHVKNELQIFFDYCKKTANELYTK